MSVGFSLFFNSVLLGVGLAMDAFSVSLANGLNEPEMKRGRMCLIAGVFAVFQAMMPLLGWICIHTIVQYFQAFEAIIPWIALLLLVYIGIHMILDGIWHRECESNQTNLGIYTLIVQGIATSIDALSVGFTIASYDLLSAVTASAIIAVVTFLICLVGVMIGRTAGTKLVGKAGVIGGLILIFIGLEIFISSWL